MYRDFLIGAQPRISCVKPVRRDFHRRYTLYSLLAINPVIRRGFHRMSRSGVTLQQKDSGQQENQQYHG